MEAAEGVRDGHKRGAHNGGLECRQEQGDPDAKGQDMFPPPGNEGALALLLALSARTIGVLFKRQSRGNCGCRVLRRCFRIQRFCWDAFGDHGGQMLGDG